MQDQEERGLVLIFTGRGKGKTTAALGAALRASGQGFKVLIIQFIKAGGYYGELESLKRLAGVEVRSLGLGLIGRDQDLAPHREKARQAWDQACREVASGRWDLVILDEICVAMKRDFVQPEELAGLIRQKPRPLNLIITGRDCPEHLFDLADTVTRMEEVKHHLAAGVPARRGIEY